MKQSPLFTLNWNDALKGLITAVASSVVSVLMNSINEGNFIFSWTAIWHGALVGGIGYIAKNFFTPSTPTKTVTQDADGKVTKTVIETDSVKVNVDQNTK